MDPTLNPHEVELREQDRWLPIANVSRLMKNTLPSTAKVSKDAKECMQECVSEFISFLTSEASERCLREKRKTINGEDILYLMHDLGFENYAEALKIYLAKYREQQAIKQERGDTRASRKQSRNVAAETVLDSPEVMPRYENGRQAFKHDPAYDNESEHFEDGAGQYDQRQSFGSRDQYENSQDYESGDNQDRGFFYDREKMKLEPEEQSHPLQQVHKHDEYPYHAFISDPTDEQLNLGHHIDELTKQLTNEDPQMEPLDNNGDYF